MGLADRARSSAPNRLASCSKRMRASARRRSVSCYGGRKPMLAQRYFATSLLVLVSLEGLPEPTRQGRDVHSQNNGFVDVTRQAGIAFRHVNAATGEKFLVETMGSGCAWLDYDGDGLMDLYLVNGRPLPGFKAEKPLSNALY